MDGVAHVRELITRADRNVSGKDGAIGRHSEHRRSILVHDPELSRGRAHDVLGVEPVLVVRVERLGSVEVVGDLIRGAGAVALIGLLTLAKFGSPLTGAPDVVVSGIFCRRSMWVPLTRTLTIVGSKSGTGNVRRSFGCPFGPRSVNM
jgi:hypothetical protein